MYSSNLEEQESFGNMMVLKGISLHTYLYRLSLNLCQREAEFNKNEITPILNTSTFFQPLLQLIPSVWRTCCAFLFLRTVPGSENSMKPGMFDSVNTT